MWQLVLIFLTHNSKKNFNFFIFFLVSKSYGRGVISFLVCISVTRFCRGGRAVFTLSRFYVLRFTLCAFRFTLYALRLTLYAYNYSDTRCLTLVVLYSLSLSSLFYTGPLTLTLYYSLSYTRSFMLALFTLFLTSFPLPTYVYLYISFGQPLTRFQN